MPAADASLRAEAGTACPGRARKLAEGDGQVKASRMPPGSPGGQGGDDHDRLRQGRLVGEA